MPTTTIRIHPARFRCPCCQTEILSEFVSDEGDLVDGFCDQCGCCTSCCEQHQCMRFGDSEYLEAMGF